MDNIISVTNVTKNFKIYKDRSHTLKDKILKRSADKHDLFCAVDDISFQVGKNQSIGIIGRNGSGKSTVLKLLTRIIYPTAGSIDIKGRVSSLLELGAGFHPDFTGRENVYVNASIFGLSKKEIDKKFEHILSFSELENVIDAPVRTYSSGMYMRLAFSVAINVNQDVLLIDEILAVGDENFQQKCHYKLKQLKNDGTTIIIVSHDLGSIRKICDRVIWMNEGKIMMFGEPNEVIEQYMTYMDGIKTSIE